MNQVQISSEFPFKSNYIEVIGSEITKWYDSLVRNELDKNKSKEVK